MVSLCLSDTPSKPRSGPEPGRLRRSLLIVDDEEGPRQSLKIVFKDDYDLWLAASGAEALAIAHRHGVDAAVVDIRMPGMSGIEVLAQLKDLDPATEVIILTAYETLDTARQALRLGAFDYLTKPFDLATVRAAVAKAMQRRAGAEQARATDSRLRELQEELQSQRLNEEILRNRGEIYACVLHDINSPLTVIASFISMLNLRLGNLEALDARGTRDFKEHLEAVDRQVNNCVHITQRYLGFLRQGSDEPSRVNLNQVLRDLLDLLNAHPDAQHCRFEIVPLPEDREVVINGTDLIQILLNLTINAFQSSSARHLVEITAAMTPRQMDLGLFEEGPADRFLRHAEFDPKQPLLAVTVRDTGPGMPPEIVQKIFREPFTTKPPKHGTGLGLSIVKRLVFMAKAALTMHTEPGRGTRFTLYLPVASAGAPAVQS